MKDRPNLKCERNQVKWQKKRPKKPNVNERAENLINQKKHMRCKVERIKERNNRYEIDGRIQKSKEFWGEKKK